MGKKSTGGAKKDAAAEEVRWKPWFAELQALNEHPEGAVRALPGLVGPHVVSIVQALKAAGPSSVSSHKLFTSLQIGELNACISHLDPSNVGSAAMQVVGLNSLLRECPGEFSAILVEHAGFVEGLAKLHKAVKNLTHGVSQAVLVVLWTLVVKCSVVLEDVSVLVRRPALLELPITHLIFLSTQPGYFSTWDGCQAAWRCVRICYELSKNASPGARAARALLLQADVPRRLLALLALPPTEGSAAGAEQEQQQPEAAASSSSEGAGSGDQETAKDNKAEAEAEDSSAEGSSADDDVYSARLRLLTMGSSFITSIMGLGSAGTDLSAASLAPIRTWLLAPGTLQALKQPLWHIAQQLHSGRLDGMVAQAQAAQAAAQAAFEASQGQSREAAEEVALASMKAQQAQEMVAALESALRNLLFYLTVPTVVRGNSPDQIAAGINFVIEYYYALYTEGLLEPLAYINTACVGKTTAATDLGTSPSRASTPATTASTPDAASTASSSGAGVSVISPSALSSSDYSPFFRAITSHLMTVAPVVGKQLSEWGVEFKAQQGGTGMRNPLLQVSEGTNAQEAHAWITKHTPQILQWGQAAVQALALGNKETLARRAAVEAAVAAARKAREQPPGAAAAAGDNEAEGAAAGGVSAATAAGEGSSGSAAAAAEQMAGLKM